MAGVQIAKAFPQFSAETIFVMLFIGVGDRDEMCPTVQMRFSAKPLFPRFEVMHYAFYFAFYEIIEGHVIGEEVAKVIAEKIECFRAFHARCEGIGIKTIKNFLRFRGVFRGRYGSFSSFSGTAT